MFRQLKAAAIVSVLLYTVEATAQPPGGASNSERSPKIAAFVEERYQHADELNKARKGVEALAAINEAIRFDSDCGKCFGLKSGIEGNLQKYREGVADGHTGVQRSKTSRHKAMSAYNKGFNLGGLDRNSEALEAYNDSIRFDPTYAAGYFGKGKTLYFLGKWADSKAVLEDALILNPKNGAAWAYLAEDQMNLGDARAGLASSNQAVELAPNDARSFRARTIAHYWDGNFDAMLADATRTLEIDPTRHHAHLLRGHALKLLGRNDEAEREYAVEPDRKAVEAGLHPSPQVDLRVYNCGDNSTELQTPLNFNVDGFTECSNRIMEQLDEVIRQLEALPTPKKSVPGLPATLPKKK